MKILAKAAAVSCAALILLAPGTGCWTALAGDFAAPDAALPAGGVTAVPGMNMGQMPSGEALPFENLGADAQMPNLGSLSQAQILKSETAPAALPQAAAMRAAKSAVSAAPEAAEASGISAAEPEAETAIQATTPAPRARKTILNRIVSTVKAVLSGKNQARSGAAAVAAGERTFDGLAGAAASSEAAAPEPAEGSAAAWARNGTPAALAADLSADVYPPYRPDMVRVKFHGGSDQLVEAWKLLGPAAAKEDSRGIIYFNFNPRTQTALALLTPELYYRFDEARRDIFKRSAKLGGIVQSVEPVPVAPPMMGELKMYLELHSGKARILSVPGVQSVELKTSAWSDNAVVITLAGTVPEALVKRELLRAAPWLFRYPAGYVVYVNGAVPLAPAAAPAKSRGLLGLGVLSLPLAAKSGALPALAAISIGAGFLHVGIVAGAVVAGMLVGGYIGRKKGLASRDGGGGGYWNFGTPLYTALGALIGAIAGGITGAVLMSLHALSLAALGASLLHAALPGLGGAALGAILGGYIGVKKAKADGGGGGYFNIGPALYGAIGALIGAAVLGTAAAALGAHFLGAHAAAHALTISSPNLPGFPPSWTAPSAQAYAPDQGFLWMQALKAMLPALKAYAIAAAVVVGVAMSFYVAMLLTELRSLKSGKTRKTGGSSGTPKA
ncbi:MAG TPA: hypothetical protein VNH15_01125 [Elusimicrobiota bacterium]|nr:hypothetical protein [Elusimicrobiota bacterium]